MVEQNQEEGAEVNLEEKLDQAWSSLLSSQQQAASFLNESARKSIGGDLGQLAFFNNKLDINRFFVDEGDGSNVPEVFFSKNQSGQPDNSAASEKPSEVDDLFEEQLDSALQVFKSGGANTDLLQENASQILFYVDLENEEIIDKETYEEQKVDDEAEGQIGERPHPMLFNQYPLCQSHSLFLLFAEHCFPQVLSNELIQLLLQIFKVSTKSSLRLGYNSMGADCIINNLHFHVLTTEQLFGADVEQFPIEQAGKQLFFKSSLKHKDEGEINMFNCGVRFGEVVGWPVQTLLLSPQIEDDETELEDAQEALAHAASVVLNHFIEANIPHNILIADEGMTLYIIPRKFDMLVEGVHFFTSFESLCGFVKMKNHSEYETAQWSQVAEILASQVSMGKPEFEQLKETIVNKFLSEYQGERIVEGGAGEQVADVEVAVKNMQL